MNRLWEEPPANPPMFRDAAVFMMELFETVVVLLHVTSLAKVTTYKKGGGGEEQLSIFLFIE